MSTPIPRAPTRSRLWALITAVSLALWSLIAVAAPALAGQPDGSGGTASEQEVAAITQSGTVLVTTTWVGYVGVQDPTDGTYSWSDETTAFVYGSGFVADNSGYVVTAGHVVDPQEGRTALIEQAVADEVTYGDTTQAEAEQLLPSLIAIAKVEGINNGDPIARTVEVYQLGAAAGIEVSSPLTANVVELRPLAEGDVALLKVQAPALMPALQVAGSVPDVGAQIAVMGFPASVSGVVDEGLQPSFKTGRVSAVQNSNGVPFLQIDAAVSSGMSGGPVVNMQGEVVGTVSFSPSGETQSFNFAASQETISALMNRNDVTTTLSQTDQTYREAVHAYYSGDYQTAMSGLDSVLAAAPSHASAQALRAKAAQAAQQNPTAPATTPISTGGTNGGSSNTWLIVGIAVAAVLAVGAVAFFLIRRRPKAQPPVPPVPPVGATPSSPYPIAPTGGMTAGPGMFPASGWTPEAGAVPDPAAALPTRVCTICGAPNPGWAVACMRCGDSLNHRPPTQGTPLTGSRS